MRTEQIKIYQFKELNTVAQKKAIEWYKDKCVNDDIDFNLDESGTMKEHCIEQLKKNKIRIIRDFKIQYSLSNSQGDGFSFVGVFKWKSYVIFIKATNMYVHERSTTIEAESEMTGKEWNDKTQEEFKQLYYSICRYCEKIGYEIIEDCYKEESIIDTIESNEYEFRENGERWHYVN